jgi:hypothetical protein
MGGKCLLLEPLPPVDARAVVIVRVHAVVVDVPDMEQWNLF